MPVLYALLPNKVQQTYQRMLMEFSKWRQFNPEAIVTDFERAMMNAVQFVFPVCHNSGVSVTFLSAYTAKFSIMVCKLITLRKTSRFLFVC